MAALGEHAERTLYRAAIAGSVLLCAGFAAWTHFKLGGGYVTAVFDDAVMTLMPASAGVLCLRRRAHESGRARAAWLLFGLSYLAFTAGMLYWGYAQLVRNVAVPYPSVGDIGFLAAIPLMGAGLLWAPLAEQRSRTRLRSALDALIIASALFFLAWALTLGPIYHSATSSALAKTVGLAYPIGYLTVLVFVLLQLARAPAGGLGAATLMAGSVACLTAVNLPYAKMCIDGTYYTGHPIDVLWIGAFCLGALAALRPPDADDRARERARPSAERVRDSLQIALPYIPVAASGLLGFGIMITNRRFGVVLTMTALVVVALVLLRQYLALSDVRELGRSLELALAARTAELAELGRLEAEEARQVDELTKLAQALDQKTRALSEANMHIQEANRLKSRFLANMSHELRTPLNSIIGFSEILLTRLKDLEPKHNKFLSNIHTAGTHLLGLINDLLDLSKIEAGRMSLAVERVQPHQLAEASLTIMRGVAQKKGVELKLEAPTDLPSIDADAARLKQVLYNLLSNAVKFSPDGEVVLLTLRLLAPGDSSLGVESIEIAVRDRGVGIDPKHHALVFEEFRQVDDANTRQAGGTGLGLALVKKFVELHRGEVGLISRLGEGATFVVTLPRRQQAPQPIIETERPRPAVN